MRKSLIIYILIICVFFSGAVFVSLKYANKDSSQIINFPVPEYLTMVKNNQISSLSFWLPGQEVKGSANKKPDITAKSALVYDLSTGKILYSKNPRIRLPMASLTKIMTAIIALENPKEDDKYYVKDKSLVGENSMYLTNGEILSLEELLYGLILVSANDAAEVLADNYEGGRDKFIEAMNNKAKALGLSDTNFTNPSGLQGDGNQYTTATDYLVITRYALSNFNLFKKVSSTYEYTVTETIFHKAHYLQNETNLLTTYPGVKGIKTGYTPEAGLCLVTYLEHENHKIIGILLGSNNRRQEMKELLDYSLQLLGAIPPKHN